MNVNAPPPSSRTEPLPTGVDGLDEILAGGYASNRVHLIEGQPGTGKTTLALQFLRDGQVRGEHGLYITLSESKDELLHVAGTHGWTLEGIQLFELVPPELSLGAERHQSVFYASDLELAETVKLVMDEVARVRPARVVFDSLSEIRLLAQGALRYRRQVLALKHFFARQGCTVLFLDDLTEATDDLNLHSLVHGVIRLEYLAIAYGEARRRLRVFKMRGREFRGGFHDYVIRRGGVVTFPRIAMPEDGDGVGHEPVASGLAELDRLVGGGLDRGTSTLIMGPSGSGKSSLALCYVVAALRRGEKALVVSFDETRSIFLRRASGLGITLDRAIEHGSLILKPVDPAEISPGELSHSVRQHVEESGVDVVVLDSVSGYQNAIPEEHAMLLQMHELLTYLNVRGVLSILVLAQHGLVGPMQSGVDLTYLSDTVILLRFFESGGKVRRAMSVLKKRTGGHEDTIREYRIGPEGIQVGPPLDAFQGVLSGVPTYTGATSSLLGANGHGGR